MIADVSNDRQLDEEEFILAMFLISSKIKTGSIPELPVNNSIPSPSPSATTLGKMTTEEKQKYKEIFKRASVEINNSFYVDQEQAKKLFSRSNLPSTDLAKIWYIWFLHSFVLINIRELSDVDSDGKLNETQFIIAMYLINSKLKGIELPDILPDFLKSELGNFSDDKKTMKQKPQGNYNIDLSEIVTNNTPSNSTPSSNPTPNPTPVIPITSPTIVNSALNTSFSDFSTPPVPLPPLSPQPSSIFTFLKFHIKFN